MNTNRFLTPFVALVGLCGCASSPPPITTPSVVASLQCPAGTHVYCDHRRGADGRCGCQRLEVHLPTGPGIGW